MEQQVFWVVEKKLTKEGRWWPKAGAESRAAARRAQDEVRKSYRWTRIVKYVREAA